MTRIATTRTATTLRRVAPIALTMGLLAAAPPVAAGGPANDSRGAATTTVVQLGDSYSAGNGTGTYTEKSCWRSPLSYGAQVSESIGATYVNVACSGGVVRDILEPRALGDTFPRTRTYTIDPGEHADPWAEWERRATEDDLCGVPAQPDMYYSFTVTGKVAVGMAHTATAQCQLMTEPQVNAVSPKTDHVFLTVGGNDLGFSNIVVQCLVVRDPAGCRSVIDDANARLPQMRDAAVAALRVVHERSRGQAQVHLLTYPFLLNTDTYGIPEVAPSYDAGKALHDLQVVGDAAQASIVRELNATTPGSDFHVVDTVKAAWGGHAHGLDPHVAADNSQAWLVPVLAPGRERPEWVHPTLTGWTATAGALREAVTG